MTGRTTTLAAIERGGVIAVLRGVTDENVTDIGDALAAGGVTALEVTADTPDVAGKITTLVRHLDDESIVIGAGTVLDAETARAVLLAGAQFIVTPTLNPTVIQTANRYSVPVFPGVMTPTEALKAIEAGADAVKLFPAKTVGPAHLSAIHGPLEHIPIVPTGGISLDNVREYISAGALAVGVGGALIADEFIEKDDWNGLTDRAAAFIEAIDSARE